MVAGQGGRVGGVHAHRLLVDPDGSFEVGQLAGVVITVTQANTQVGQSGKGSLGTSNGVTSTAC